MAPRKAKAIWQHRFDLDQDVPEQTRLHEHLDELAKSGKASDWIRQTLCAALATNDQVLAYFKKSFLPAQLRPVPKVPADATYSDDDVETP